MASCPSANGLRWRACCWRAGDKRLGHRRHRLDPHRGHFPDYQGPRCTRYGGSRSREDGGTRGDGGVGRLWRLGPVGGLLLGRAVGDHAISLHMHGTLYGTEDPLSPSEAVVWMLYNFIFYALLPYLFFRSRGYSNEQLNLKSSNKANDALLIVVILLLESAIELSLVSSAILGLEANQLLIGIPLSFLLNLFGTGFPIMIFIYAILLPRFLKLTGSVAATIVLGGVAYATIHFFEAWTTYDTVANGMLSVIFLMFQYFGPGMVKSVLTLRTGNAWVHLWAYHAIAPHVTVDTPNIVNVFKLR